MHNHKNSSVRLYMHFDCLAVGKKWFAYMTIGIWTQYHPHTFFKLRLRDKSRKQQQKFFHCTHANTYWPVLAWGNDSKNSYELVV